MNELFFWFMTMATWVRRNLKLRIASSPLNSLYSILRLKNSVILYFTYIRQLILDETQYYHIPAIRNRDAAWQPEQVKLCL